MRPFTVLINEGGAISNRGMAIEHIIEDFISGKLSRSAKVCVVGEFADPDEIISSGTAEWKPPCVLSNIHWMAMSGISDRKLTFLKGLTGEQSLDDTVEPKSMRRYATLLSTANINLYRENAFRVTGLTVSATAKQIAKRTDELRVLEELGFGGASGTSAFKLEPPPSVDQIRESLQRLKEPEHRLIDEFFWFWPRSLSDEDDSAIQAFQAGDANKAHEIWTEWESNPEIEHIAWHNIAVMFHLIGIDWTQHQFASSVDDDRSKKIELYWKEAFDRWEKLVSDDRIWDVLKSRIRAIDDARLTTGFARRIRESLPQALMQINGEIALLFIEHGDTAWAQTHVSLVKTTFPSQINSGNVLDAVLEPLRGRILQKIKSSKAESAEKASEGLVIAKGLIDQADKLRPTFHLFDSGTNLTYELFDELATASVDCLVAFRKAGGSSSAFVLALKETLPLATSKEVVNRINTNIQFGLCQPLNEILKGIAESKASASKKFAEARNAMPDLAKLGEEIGVDTEAYRDCSDFFALILKGIAVTAYNDENDKATASLAIRIADKLVYDSDLRARIKSDMEIVSSDTGEAECFFCNNNIGQPKRKVQVAMHKVTEQTAKGVRYSTNKVSVPRCENCYKLDNRHWKVMWWGAIGGAAVGAFLPPFAATGGVGAVVLILLGMFIMGTSNAGARQAIGYLFLLLLVFGFGLCAAVYDSDFARASAPNMVGGALIGGVIVFWIARRKILKERPVNRACGHSSIGQKVKEGWQFGEKPFGYT
jgi:hypothetical protein